MHLAFVVAGILLIGACKQSEFRSGGGMQSGNPQNSVNQ